MKIMTVLILAPLISCRTEMTRAGSNNVPATSTARDSWQALVDAPDRSRDDRNLDPGRHPVEFLEFLDLKSGMKVVDLGAGGGYTTELLVRAVGPSGVVYMHNRREAAQGFAREAIAERLTHPVMKNVLQVERPFEEPLPPDVHGLDAAIMYAVYHDVANTNTNRLEMNRAVFKALRPRGIYVVVDSSATPGSGLAATSTLHRIDERVVRQEVTAAGFRLVTDSDILRNANDPRDWNSSPRAAGDRRGTSDRFVLKFVKPE
jgi:predicted methyltransferase